MASLRNEDKSATTYDWETPYREYHELIQAGLVADQAVHGAFGPEKHARLVSKGLLRPVAHDSTGQPFYDRAEVERHAGFQDPSVPNAGCCECCGHCEVEIPNVSTAKGLVAIPLN